MQSIITLFELICIIFYILKTHGRTLTTYATNELFRVRAIGVEITLDSIYYYTRIFSRRILNLRELIIDQCSRTRAITTGNNSITRLTNLYIYDQLLRIFMFVKMVE